MARKLFPLFVILIIAVFVSLNLKTNLLITTFLFFGAPSIYLTSTLKNKKIIPRLLIAALLGSSTLAILIDYLGFINQSWYVVDTIFPFRIYNFIPVEDLIWGFLWIYLIFVFYENSFQTGNESILGKRAKYWFGISAIAVLTLFLVQNLNPSILVIPYYYLIFGIILSLFPAVLFLRFFPKYIRPFLKTAAYIVPVCLANEIVSLKLGHWYFPQDGKFVSMINIFEVTFPFEELVFFILIGSTFVLSYYEFFDGDTT